MTDTDRDLLEQDDECDCERPRDNDLGECMNCGRWIGYRDQA